jgi:hypothetical protein
MKEENFAKIIILWILFISISIGYFSQSQNNNTPFYKIGPNDKLIILNITIDTPIKYSLVVLYSIFNNIIRNLNNIVLNPWITHNIQDNTQEGVMRKIILNKKIAYEINTVNTIYKWFDFLIYIHLLLSQIDIFFIEATSDVLIVTIITKFWFLYFFFH